MVYILIQALPSLNLAFNEVGIAPGLVYFSPGVLMLNDTKLVEVPYPWPRDTSPWSRALM